MKKKKPSTRFLVLILSVFIQISSFAQGIIKIESDAGIAHQNIHELATGQRLIA